MRNQFIIQHIILVTILLFTSQILVAQPTQMQTNITSGIGFGSIIAIVASWDRNKSILWCIIHGICSWFYVIYYVFTKK